jgi:hypothetical protein
MKTSTFFTGLLVFGAAAVSLENIGKKYSACETYQGYTEDPKGEGTFYVFDHQGIEARTRDARFSMIGNGELKDSLRIGDRYCFAYMDPINPLASLKLRSVQPDTSQ